jgi:hypothetical protein
MNRKRHPIWLVNLNHRKFNSQIAGEPRQAGPSFSLRNLRLEHATRRTARLIISPQENH